MKIAAYLTDTRRARWCALAMATLASACATGSPVQVDEYHWKNVDRVVAFGDLHGDYDQYLEALRSAGLIDRRDRWAGGQTHLVQTGDVPDRGPDSRRIIEHLKELKEQAEKDGGQVHTLIGNHEAMNSYGDLRYVHPGEYEAFRTRNSKELRERQWQFSLRQLEQSRPEEFAQMDLEAYREEWEKQVPLGWVELRLNWEPRGPLGQWVLSNPVAVQINDTIFVHGGLSPEYCHLDLAELTRRAHAELRDYDPETPGVIDDENGPLWFRGLATANETSFAPVLEQILARYGAQRIVVGHTPTGGVVWPRFDGRVVVNDVGMGAYYGSNDGFLLIEDGKAYAVYGDHRLPLPTDEAGRLSYLEAVVALKPDNEDLVRRLEQLRNPPEPEATAQTEAPEGDPDSEDPVDASPVSHGICQ
ncbi:MAG: metallophosphoesterase [Xanthomonadales bacterium]|nr:metallophosphoesterase [Xanthomonadales bacterium]